MNEIIIYDPNHKTKEEKNWGMLCHLLALTGVFIPLGIILGPLVMWLMKKNESKFVEKEGKAALNFQLTMLIGLICSVPFMIIGVGFISAFFIVLASMFLAVVAAVKSSEGKHYNYPFSLNLIK